jgi:hypothetical protein
MLRPLAPGAFEVYAKQGLEAWEAASRRSLSLAMVKGRRALPQEKGVGKNGAIGSFCTPPGGQCVPELRPPRRLASI